jgi:uncharacterized DUF497 family protein
MDQANDQLGQITEFEWDEKKNDLNIQKHSIDFENATEIFYAPFVARKSDRRGEARWLVIGRMDARIIAAVVTKRGNAIRIISARHARKNEERAYHQKTLGRPP